MGARTSVPVVQDGIRTLPGTRTSVPVAQSAMGAEVRAPAVLVP